MLVQHDKLVAISTSILEAAGAPADKAGVKGGDIIVSLSGKELKNIYDYTYVLGALKVDEETEIKVKRKGKVISLKILPSSRD